MELALAFWEPILVLASYTAVIALGQYVSMSSGVLSVAHAALAGIGAYTAGALTAKLAIPLLPAVVVGIGGGFLAGLVIGFLSARLAPLVAGLMTLAFAEVMVVAAYNIEPLGGANGLSGVPISVSLPLASGVLAGVILLVWRYDSSRIGIAARATRDDPDAAAAVGIPIVQIKALTFAMGGAIAAAGGALQIHYITVITPDELGFWNGVNYLVFVVLGGSFVVWGPLVGTVLLILLPEVLRFSESDRFIIYGALLTLMIILRPQGLITRRIPSYRTGTRLPPIDGMRAWLMRVRGWDPRESDRDG